MYQSQQKLENKSLVIGLLVASLLYGGTICGYYYFKPSKKQAPVLNITKIDLDMFEIGGGLNDAPPTPDEPINEVLEPEEILKDEAEVIEEIVEPETIEEVVEVVEEIEPIEDIITPEVVEKKPEPKKIDKKPEPKKVVKKPAPKKPVNKVEKKEKPAKKPSNSGGYNAYNPNSNKVASSAITGENTIQTLSASEQKSIGAQIQAIIAREAKKNYPTKAKRLRQRGTSVISFTYNPDGSVTNIRVKNSSGYKILDDTVIQTINKVKSRFPKIKASATFETPVKFTLN